MVTKVMKIEKVAGINYFCFEKYLILQQTETTADRATKFYINKHFYKSNKLRRF
jgi:hypothetical protein